MHIFLLFHTVSTLKSGNRHLIDYNIIDTSEKFNKCVIPGLTRNPSCRLAYTLKD
jgi:hypothetical protein